MSMIKLPYIAEEEVREERLAICANCPFIKNGRRCAKCGCFVRLKAKLANSKCPCGKWPDGENYGVIDEESTS